MNRRLLILLAGLVLSFAVVLGGVLWLLVGALRPPPPAPDLVSTPRTPVVAQGFLVTGQVLSTDGDPVAGLAMGLESEFDMDLPEVRAGRTGPDGTYHVRVPRAGRFTVLDVVSEPGNVQVEQETHDLDFTVPPICPVLVRVETPEGAPVANAHVSARTRVEDRKWSSNSVFRGDTDTSGTVVLPNIPCGRVTPEAWADGYATTEGKPRDSREDPRLTVVLAPGLLLDGTVRRADGTPLPDVAVSFLGGLTHTDEEGLYTLWVPPGSNGTLQAWRMGFIAEQRTLRLPEEGGVTMDLVLQALRRVSVWCAGLPDDSCAGVEPGVFCTQPMLLMGETCGGAAPTLCACPEGEAAIRGGGASTRVGPDETEAWLDFRHGGGISGRALLEGEPVRCRLHAFRLPDWLPEDLSRGFLTARTGRCEEDGTFLMPGLKQGTWRLQVQFAGRERSLARIAVADRVVDLGDVELTGGGTIEGIVVDGLTGTPQGGVPVWGTLTSEPALSLPAGFDESDRDGRFSMQGLSEGTWRLLPLPWMTGGQTVTVTDGEVSRVRIELGDAAVARDNGFTVVSGGTGEIVIDTVDPDGFAAEAGLQPGDVVESATLFGMDLATVRPDLPGTVLSRYGGPGLGLVVDRDGQRITLDLE